MRPQATLPFRADSSCMADWFPPAMRKAAAFCSARLGGASPGYIKSKAAACPFPPKGARDILSEKAALFFLKYFLWQSWQLWKSHRYGEWSLRTAWLTQAWNIRHGRKTDLDPPPFLRRLLLFYYRTGWKKIASLPEISFFVYKIFIKNWHFSRIDFRLNIVYTFKNVYNKKEPVDLQIWMWGLWE